jgi:hypothetical protein
LIGAQTSTLGGRVKQLATFFAIALGVVPAVVSAHHSAAAWFNQNEIQEVEGVVTEVDWQNPHVKFLVRAPNAAGEEVIWDMETLSVAGISRWGITADMIEVGDRVKVAGNPSRRGLDNLFVRNILLPSGEEILLGGKPRWSDRTLKASEIVDATEGVGTAPEKGIFRVWSTGAGTAMIFPENINRDFDFSRYPLTESARAAVDAFDYLEDDPTNGCVPKGMSLIMEEPYPLEFSRDGDDIVLRLEEYDTVRTIHMNDGAGAAEAPFSPLGYSVGRWDGRDLVVTTTRINSGTFDSVGIGLSLQAEIVERFSPSEDGSRLDYSMTVTDPETFTRPVELGKHWIWLPEVELQKFGCRD